MMFFLVGLMGASEDVLAGYKFSSQESSADRTRFEIERVLLDESSSTSLGLGPLGI